MHFADLADTDGQKYGIFGRMLPPPWGKIEKNPLERTVFRFMNQTEQTPSLVIMAAGMGSRFGGLKQVAPVGPSGERIIDYSVYDALAAGFSRIVFVIKREMEETFREDIGGRIARHADVAYVHQEQDALPAGFAAPPGRVKPWGTGHAVLCCRDAVPGPFAVINADDYYGRDSYSLLYRFLTGPKPEDSKLHLAMAGYVLENTLTENGYVSRGVCEVDGQGYLRGLTERTHIELRDGRAMYTEDEGASWHALPAGCQVSMNCWAFPAGMMDRLQDGFVQFLSSEMDPLKSEFYLPSAVDSLVQAGQADVRVLKTRDRWYGMTYRQDCEKVAGAIRALVDQGIYPERLWAE